METKKDWENDQAEDNQAYIDNRSVDLTKPMTEDDYLYKPPKEPMTVKKFLSGTVCAIGITIVVLLVIIVIAIAKFSAEKEKKERADTASAKENLKKFLCSDCGLSEDAYTITESYSKRMTFKVGGKEYTLQRAQYSDYLTEEFTEKMKAHVTKTLAESKLMQGVKFEVPEITILSNGPIDDGFLPITITRKNMDRVLSYKTAENQSIMSATGDIRCVIRVIGEGERTFSGEQFAGIEELWYIDHFVMESDRDESGDGEQ